MSTKVYERRASQNQRHTSRLDTIEAKTVVLDDPFQTERDTQEASVVQDTLSLAQSENQQKLPSRWAIIFYFLKLIQKNQTGQEFYELYEVLNRITQIEHESGYQAELHVNQVALAAAAKNENFVAFMKYLHLEIDQLSAMHAHQLWLMVRHQLQKFQ